MPYTVQCVNPSGSGASRPGRAAQAEGRRVPLSRQLLLFSSTLLVVTSTSLVLLFKKDTGVLIRAAREGQGLRFHELVTIEVAFVTAVLLVAGVILAQRFGANLQAMFELELRSLEAVDEGRYDVPVPLVSNDEFRVVAASTNQMLAGLAERDRIRATFGRYVSPAVAQAILEHEGGAELGGRQVDVAVLFSDLRNFTPLSERLAPRELVAFLNEYFAEMVEELHAAGGVVDKFIGDAVMAVFGLEGREDPCGRALDAALGMQVRVEELNTRLEVRGLPPVACGVGIHFGPVIAGNIGSPERLEYTVIGDSVNVAARLESKTKELGVGVAVSAEVRKRLDGARREKLRELGAQELKGKSAAVEVYGV